MNGTPASTSPGITGFTEIFESRLNKMKLHLKEELDKAKHERDRMNLRRLIADARKLKKTLKDMRKASAKKCPHCGGEL